MTVRRVVPGKSVNIEESWECFDVTAQEAYADYTATLTLPAYTTIQRVLAYVLHRPVVTTGTAKFKLGTTADDDGLILEQDISAQGLPGSVIRTLMGNDIEELGDLLVTHHTPQDPDYSDIEPVQFPAEALMGTLNTSETTLVGTITIGTANASGKGIVRVWVKYLRLLLEE